MFVCLSDCLSLRSHISKTRMLKFHEMFCKLTRYPWPWLGSPLTTVQQANVTYFRFCGWRHVFAQCGQYARIKHDVVSSSSEWVGRQTSWDNVMFGWVRQMAVRGRSSSLQLRACYEMQARDTRHQRRFVPILKHNKWLLQNIFCNYVVKTFIAGETEVLVQVFFSRVETKRVQQSVVLRSLCCILQSFSDILHCLHVLSVFLLDATLLRNIILLVWLIHFTFAINK